MNTITTQVATSRSQFYYDLPAGPFYKFNRPGAKDPTEFENTLLDLGETT